MVEKATITLTVNGERFQVPVDDPSRTLLDFLRRDLGLTGAKNGCDGKGTCGACTVLIAPGRAVKSCQVLLSSLSNAEILTIEGLSAGGLHPLQEAFIRHGAIQCGYCTPGMIMASKALLDRNPHPTRKEIAQALSGNLCRCTGYVKIIDAVEAAAKSLAFGEERRWTPSRSEPAWIGAPLPPKGAIEKATGRLKFADDIPSKGALIARVVWSVHDHAQILSIRTERALAVPGVTAVLTADDVPGQNVYGLIRDDQPVLCADRVRYRGDPVALVLAETVAAAEAGAAAVEVDYQPLPPVFEPAEALTEGASPLFESGNLACEFKLQHGEILSAMSDASLIVSGDFTTQAVEHAYLEPEAGVAEWNDGKVTVRAACQYPQTIQKQLAKILGVREEEVRVISHPTGGAFGGKTGISVHALLALAAAHSKRRVKLTWSREESLRASVKRHPMRLKYQIGFDAEGRIVGVKGRILANAGSYYTLSIPLLEQTTAFSTGPYRVPNVDVIVRGVFTNTPPSSAFRGFGIPQPTFAIESLIDEAAERLKISPIEIRRRNALLPGDRSPTGQTMGEDTHLIETLDAIEGEYVRLKEDNREDHVGVGIACGYKNIGLGLGEDDYAEAWVTVKPAGWVDLRVGAVDLGQGSATVTAQIVSHEFGIPFDRVRVVWGDTAESPDGRETNASRQTVVSGNAVLEAVRGLRKRVLKVTADLYPDWIPPLVLEAGAICDNRGHGIDLFELASILEKNGEQLVSRARYTAPKTVPLGSLTENLTVEGAAKNYFTYAFFSNLALVRVDPESGRVRTEQIVSAYDVGKALNRLTAEGQLEGGAVMGMGYALSERFVTYGPDCTTTLAQCGLPRITSVPTVVSRFIEAEDSLGPYGSKGIGEVAMVAVAPAILNAVHDAVGVRIHTLPATPALVRKAILRKQEGEVSP